MKNIKIIGYSDKFKEELYKIIIDSFKNSYHTNSLLGDIRKSYLIEKIIEPYLRKSRNNCMLLLKNNILVSGIIFSRIKKKYLKYAYNNIMYIFTKEEYRNKGYASLLINTVNTKFKNFTYSKISVENKNYNALKLYKQLGYKIYNKFNIYQKEIRPSHVKEIDYLNFKFLNIKKSINTDIYHNDIYYKFEKDLFYKNLKFSDNITMKNQRNKTILISKLIYNKNKYITKISKEIRNNINLILINNIYTKDTIILNLLFKNIGKYINDIFKINKTVILEILSFKKNDTVNKYLENNHFKSITTINNLFKKI